MSVKIFFCYAHEDEILMNKLKSHLRPLQRQGLIDIWHDRDISAGTEWKQEISKNLNDAQIILLLVSPDFMNSDYCYSVEMKRAMERHKRGHALVIPVILRPIYWQSELGNLQALPTDAKPVTGSSWHSLDEAFFDVAEGIRKAIEDLVMKPLMSPSNPKQADQNPVMEQTATISKLELTSETNLENIPWDKEAVSTSSLNKSETSQDISDIHLAIIDETSRDNSRFAKAVFRRMGATNPILIKSPVFEEDILWEVLLPPIGLRLHTQKFIVCLRQKQLDQTAYDFLAAITSERRITFILVIDVANSLDPPMSTGYAKMIWFDPKSLIEMVTQPTEELIHWLSRFIIIQADAGYLLPYKKTGAATELFVGWEYELTCLIDHSPQGGIIVGAHRSGKTSLLYQIKTRLQKLDYQVIGPLTLHTNDFKPFFERTLGLLGLDSPKELTPETWAETIMTYCKVKKPPVFILDEVDSLLALDARTGFRLGRQIRILEQISHCAFYLAGHSQLRESIELENNPFYNFTEEIILTGLTEEDSMRLIQEPMSFIGFKISDKQAHRIYHGTGGVPVLIQAFCIHLLSGSFHLTNKPEVEDEAFDVIETDHQFLSEVFAHFEYAQTPDSKAIMFITAILGRVTNRDIIEDLSKYSVFLSKRQVDERIGFLIKFGILEQSEGGQYSISPHYLFQAIMDREPVELLKVELAKRKNRTFQIDRKYIKAHLYDILKTDYVALLEQRGNGAGALIDALVSERSLVHGIRFVSISIYQAISLEDEFYKIFLERLIEASYRIFPQSDLIDKLLRTIQDSAKSRSFRIRQALEMLDTEISIEYLVIVLDGLDSVSEEILQNFFLMLRDYHDQIMKGGKGGEKIRFLMAGGMSLWRECTIHRRNVSPFNIANFIFLDSFSYEEIQAMVGNQNFETAVRLRYFTDGIPSFVIQAMESSIDIDDFSSFFEYLYDQWDALPSISQEALKKLVESRGSFPKCLTHYSCPLIPVIDSPWAEAFWEGFLRIRHHELVWRSPVHRAFVMEQANMKDYVSMPVLLKVDLLDRVERLEKALGRKKIVGMWKDGIEDAISLSVQTNNADLVPLLEMARRGENRITILKHIEYLALTSTKDWIKELGKEGVMRQSDIGNLLIQTALSRAKNYLA